MAEKHSNKCPPPSFSSNENSIRYKYGSTHEMMHSICNPDAKLHFRLRVGELLVGGTN